MLQNWTFARIQRQHFWIQQVFNPLKNLLFIYVKPSFGYPAVHTSVAFVPFSTSVTKRLELDTMLPVDRLTELSFLCNDVNETGLSREKML